MEIRTLTKENIRCFKMQLIENEKSYGTINKYIHDLRKFYHWLDQRAVNKEIVSEWKSYLQAEKYRSTTINSMLAALNSFFDFIGWNECKARFLKIQRQLFREASKELTKNEYLCLIQTAERLGKTRLSLIMETICATGIRVSEIKAITVEALVSGRAEIRLKGKIRTILIPEKLRLKLRKYARKNKITSGSIFRTGSGKCISRCQIWAEMKELCKHAGIEPSKVFPHNLRHLFATAYYEVCKDIVRLADILGHTSIETTRIYLLVSGSEHERQLESLNLIQ